MKRLPSIRHLWAITALTMAFSHLVASAQPIAGSNKSLFDITAVFCNFGVDVFFVISIFIMYYTSSEQFGQGGAAAQFLRQWLIGIVPIYWILTLFQTGILYISRMDDVDRHVSMGDLLKSLAFIPYLSDSGRYRPLQGAGWTLNYEMLFYAVFAAALFFRKRQGLALLFLTFGLAIDCGTMAHPSGALGAWMMPVSIGFLASVLLAAAYCNAPAWAGRIGRVFPFLIEVPLTQALLPRGRGRPGTCRTPVSEAVA
ncbi:hypothetical protein [Novosphingobium resinovorum]|uniref:hypothetical protein n=1 Tax=Novosphingobium resinovorum TaxID=158500 RepID=UPI002ED4FD90|nr:hypothetical protein [Novosphingobium resinovorum]